MGLCGSKTENNDDIIDNVKISAPISENMPISQPSAAALSSVLAAVKSDIIESTECIEAKNTDDNIDTSSNSSLVQPKAVHFNISPSDSSLHNSSPGPLDHISSSGSLKKKNIQSLLHQLIEQRKQIHQQYKDRYEEEKKKQNILTDTEKDALKKSIKQEMNMQLGPLDEKIKQLKARLSPNQDYSYPHSPEPQALLTPSRKHKRSQSVSDAMLDLPTTYELGERIGVGSFAKVFLGTKVLTGEHVAIKVIQASAASSDQIQKIMGEVQILSNLQHPNIVRLLETHRGRKRLFIIMEYVNGPAIAKLINEFPNGFSEPVVRHITRQALLGLAYLHEKGLAHRDFKPENMLIDIQTCEVKLCDFGSAKQFMDDGQRTVFYAWTPLYVSPEVLLEQPYDEKVDVWALGCTVIQMACGKQPWSEHNFQNMFTAQMHIASHDNALPAFPHNLSEEGCRFLTAALVRDPNNRANVATLLTFPFVNDIPIITPQDLISSNVRSSFVIDDPPVTSKLKQSATEPSNLYR